MDVRPRQFIAWLRSIPPERLLLLALLLVAVALWGYIYQTRTRPLEVMSFAVGEGDAFLITGPNGRCILLDAGSRTEREIGARTLLPNLRLLGVRRLEAIIISHPDSDHLNGLPDVIEALPVGKLLDVNDTATTNEYLQVRASAEQHHIPHVRLHAGDVVNLGGATLRILAPVEPLLTGTSSDTNNNSIVGMLEYGQARMLFTGDLEEDGEQALLSRMPNLHADVLAVAHHGSRTSAGDALLDAVTPSLAVISASGRPATDHPNAETLARLQSRGIKIYRTDVHGQVRLRTTGDEWQVETFRKAAAQ